MIPGFDDREARGGFGHRPDTGAPNLAEPGLHVTDVQTTRAARPRLLLVDGHAYAYRAWHAIRDLRAPDGRPTNAICGFIQTFEKLCHTLQPSHVAVLWDGGLAPERLEALPEYKAQRPEMPDGLRAQLDPIVEWLRARGIATGCRPGVEADDWIASLAVWGRDRDWEVIIASSDKDFMQLVGGAVGLVQPHDPSGRIWTEQDVREKTGVEPAQIVDWLSLVGDASDNIPGVPGVGPKTAAQLLKRFGSVPSLLARLSEVEPERIRRALESSADLIRRNRELIQLRADLDPGFQPDELAVHAPDVERLRTLYREWGFRTLLARLENAGRGTPPTQADLFACAQAPAGEVAAGEKLDKAARHC
ncbi:MAG: hypothetical protein KatS3mg132_602 [Limisphaera sp.]|nr:MAG: hypothetical protein KatS3mg132_602 [Limisphaera sp.]